jgi:hypothetical protein
MPRTGGRLSPGCASANTRFSTAPSSSDPSAGLFGNELSTVIQAKVCERAFEAQHTSPRALLPQNHVRHVVFPVLKRPITRSAGKECYCSTRQDRKEPFHQRCHRRQRQQRPTAIVVPADEPTSTGMSEKYEQWQAFVAAHLPSPVAREQAPDGSLYLTGGDPCEVIVRFTRSRATVFEYAAFWEGPHELVVQPVSIGSICWRRVPQNAGNVAVRALIEAAKESRVSTFRVCRYCERRNPPEWMHGRDVCQACAQKHLGIVY